MNVLINKYVKKYINIKIEKLFKEINNDDLNKNFLGNFKNYPSDKVNKSIIFERMMPGKNFLSWFQIRTEATRGGHIGGV